MGHVQRRLMNHWDFERRDKNGYLIFRPGTWAQWGPIVSFHTYGTQDEDRHSFYDGLEGARVPNPRDLNSFNRLLGARDAINACILLVNAFLAPEGLPIAIPIFAGVLFLAYACRNNYETLFAFK